MQIGLPQCRNILLRTIYQCRLVSSRSDHVAKNACDALDNGHQEKPQTMWMGVPMKSGLRRTEAFLIVVIKIKKIHKNEK